MRPQRHRAHGKIKWICPRCGAVGMQRPSQAGRRARGRVKPEE